MKLSIPSKIFPHQIPTAAKKSGRTESATVQEVISKYFISTLSAHLAKIGKKPSKKPRIKPRDVNNMTR